MSTFSEDTICRCQSARLIKPNNHLSTDLTHRSHIPFIGGSIKLNRRIEPAISRDDITKHTQVCGRFFHGDANNPLSHTDYHVHLSIIQKTRFLHLIPSTSMSNGTLNGTDGLESRFGESSSFCGHRSSLQA